MDTDDGALERRAGHFFIEAAIVLYDDLARRAGAPGAEASLIRRKIESALRLIKLINDYGDQSWDEELKRLHCDLAE